MELFLPHGPLGGRVASIASKSQLQRLLLCAALADRETVVRYPPMPARAGTDPGNAPAGR